MILKDSYNEVVFNSDDPERQLVVSELLIEKVIIFGITLFTKKKVINQDFQSKKPTGNVGFR